MFNNNYYVKELPKRQIIPLFKEGLLGHIFDTNVAPEFRKPEYYKSISLWATHMMAISKYVNEEKNDWLLVIESQVDLGHINQPKKGITLLAPDSSAYIVDRETATKIVENSVIYYDSFLNMLQHMKNLDLINVNEDIVFTEIKTNLFHKYLPFILLILFAISLFGPIYSIFSKSLVGLTKMSGTEEPSIS
jgi:hypothetical protein